jgi:MinD-like ATPase involved in chromosome partitioning or flagellar assembly
MSALSTGPVAGIVPPAAEAFMAAQKAGLPLVLLRPDSTCAVALQEFAARLAIDPVRPLDL